MAFTDGNIIIGTSVDVGGMNTGLAKIEKSFKRLGKLAILSLGIKALAQFGKAALDAASDLQEVQNVVDVGFTKTIGTVEELGDSVKDMGYTIQHTADGTAVYVEDMRYKIEEFASTAIESYGMSEFAAKQTAGSFMAMGKSMGLTMQEASDMSVTLTALTGDFASFYNISQDYARVALSAVYTGETETLKRYGIVLTEANLQEFALSQGIEANVKKMNARDKALLRYQYIMKSTADMQGDFARTSGSWANQTRILQERWKQFMIAVGDGLISVLTPLISTLNVIIGKLTQFVKLLWVIMSNIFGINLQSVTEQLGTAASNASDAADGVKDLGDATEAAGKKAKKALQPFDELNNITTPSASGSGGASDVGLNVDFDLGESLSGETLVDKIMSEIDNLYDFGKFLGDKMSDLLKQVDWERVYDGAKNFGKGLADFLNGLISTDLFKEVARTIASALNTAIYAALSFGQTFDFRQFGSKVAEAINTFFATFDFKALAQTINVWVQGLFTAVATAIKEIDWGLVLKGIGDFFSNLDPETVAILVGFVALRYVIKSAILTNFTAGLAEGLGLVPLSTLFRTFGLNMGTALAQSNIAQIIATAFTNFINSHAVLQAVKFGTTNIVQMMSSTFRAGAGSLFGSEASASALTFIAPIVKLFTGIPTLIGGMTLAVVEFFAMWKDGWSVLKTILEAIGLLLAAIGAVILGAPAAVAAVVAAVVFAISQIAILIHDNWDAIKSWIADLWNGILLFFQDIGAKIAEFFAPVGQLLDSIWLSITTFITNVMAKVNSIITWLDENIIQPIANFFEGLFLRIGQFAEGCWIIIQAIWKFVSTWFNENVIQPLVQKFEQFSTFLKNIFALIWAVVKTTWSTVNAWFNEHVIQPVISAFNNFKTIVTNVFTSLWATIKTAWAGFSTFFKNLISPVVTAFRTAINSIKTLFSGLWTSITNGLKSAMNTVISKIESAINWVIGGVNKLISGFNDIAQKAASYVGQSYSGVSAVPTVKLPRLASGAVIPPNNEFLAVLGDQKRGTNIETPLSTMIEAFNAAGGKSSEEELALLREQNQLLRELVSKDFGISGTDIFNAVKRENALYKRSTGNSAFA